jgi:hypothetical protein
MEGERLREIEREIEGERKRKSKKSKKGNRQYTPHIPANFVCDQSLQD